MKLTAAKTIAALVFSTLLLALGGVRPCNAQDFGDGIHLSKETPLAEVVAKAEEMGERPVLVRGRVADVCQRKGCWTVLQEGDTRVRVRFKDYAFFLPTDCNGRMALVEGVVNVKTLSAGLARHYEEESREGDPEAVTGPRREVGIMASGVRLLP